MNREIKIDKINKSIIFQNRGIGYTQLGVADEILNLIIDLQQENKQLKEKLKLYEEPDDMTLMFMWCDEKAKDKIKDLQQRIDKAIEYIKVEYLSKFDDFESPLRMTNEEDWEKILEILGDKEKVIKLNTRDMNITSNEIKPSTYTRFKE